VKRLTTSFFSKLGVKTMLFYVEVDKNYADHCVGMGIYFIKAKNIAEARRKAEKRCKEEFNYDENSVWKVIRVEHVNEKMTVKEFAEKVSWLLL